MLVDHEKVLGKADELFPEAIRQAENIRGNIRWWRCSLTDLEREALKYAVLSGVLRGAGGHGIIEEMRVIVTWLDEANRFNIRVVTTTTWIPEAPLRIPERVV